MVALPYLINALVDFKLVKAPVMAKGSWLPPLKAMFGEGRGGGGKLGYPNVFYPL